jgi:hypothetical protein
MKTSRYWGVVKCNSKNKWVKNNPNYAWQGSVKCNLTDRVAQKLFPTEREAALWVDKKLIELGKEPKNILKQVK